LAALPGGTAFQSRRTALAGGAARLARIAAAAGRAEPRRAGRSQVPGNKQGAAQDCARNQFCQHMKLPFDQSSFRPTAGKRAGDETTGEGMSAEKVGFAASVLNTTISSTKRDGQARWRA